MLAHISPAHGENINFFGDINVDIDTELALLGPTGTGRYGSAILCSDRSSQGVAEAPGWDCCVRAGRLKV